MWSAPINNKDLKKRIRIKLDEIDNVLSNLLVDSKTAPGLLNGQMGILSYYNYLRNIKPEARGMDQVENSLISIFENLENIKSNSFSTGLSGVLWGLNEMNADGFVEIDDEVFSECKETIENGLIHYSSADNFDYLHGAFGIAIYLIERSEYTGSQILNKWMDNFISSCEIDAQLAKKKTILDYEKNTKGYCIGLAHGVPSTILIIIKYLEKYNNKSALSLLQKKLNFLLSVKQDSDKGDCFPSNIYEDHTDYHTRLAWCYGDLGCSIALYKAGKFFERNELMNEAIRVALNCSKIRDPKSINIVDSGICHGTVGIAHIFARFYNWTKVEDFRVASEYWYNETLNMAIHNDGPAGYKHFNNILSKYEDRYCVIEGVTGIGLSMISAIENIEPKWDKSLLLS